MNERSDFCTIWEWTNFCCIIGPLNRFSMFTSYGVTAVFFSCHVSYPGKTVCRQRDNEFHSPLIFFRQVCSVKFFTFWLEKHWKKLLKETINWIAFCCFLKSYVYPIQMTNSYPVNRFLFGLSNETNWVSTIISFLFCEGTNQKQKNTLKMRLKDEDMVSMVEVN